MKLMKKKAFFWMLLLGVVSCQPSVRKLTGEAGVPKQWQAAWIGAPWEGEEFDKDNVPPAPEFRKTFRLDGNVRSASLFVTGLLHKGDNTLTVRVPEGSHGSVWLPGADAPVEVGPGRHCFSEKIMKERSTNLPHAGT